MNSNRAQQLDLTLKIIWSALLASQFLHMFVLENLLSGSEQGLLPPENMLYIFGGVAAFILLLSNIIPNLIAKNSSNPSSRFVSSIVRWAMLEAIGLFGFVSGLTYKDMNYAYPFMAVSIVSMLLNFPKPQESIGSLNNSKP